MTHSPKLIATMLAGTLMTTGACSTLNQPGVAGGGLGALGGAAAGYLLGDLVGGRNSRTTEIVGAGIGAIAGGAVGYYLDRQQKDLEARTAGTGVDVIRNGDNSLTVRAPDSITFAYNDASVRPQFRGTLEQVAQSLQAYPSSAIDVLGHTDSTGTDAYNLDLSRRRAQSVADSLQSFGVNPVRLATQGYGESQPIADNTSESGRAANRRVEIRIVPVTQN